MGLIKIFKDNQSLKNDLRLQQIENGKKQDVIRELRKEYINLQNENKKINDELKSNKKIIREIKRENRELKEVIESGRKKNRARSNTRK